MLVMLKLGGPPLMVALVVGLVISLFQAITQIHEVTIAFVPKVLAIGLTLLLMGPFMQATLSGYTRLLFDQIITIGGSWPRPSTLPSWAFVFVLVLGRIGAAMTLLPGLGEPLTAGDGTRPAWRSASPCSCCRTFCRWCRTCRRMCQRWCA